MADIAIMSMLYESFPLMSVIKRIIVLVSVHILKVTPNLREYPPEIFRLSNAIVDTK